MRRSARISAKKPVIYADVTPFSEAETQVFIRPVKKLLNTLGETEGVENRVPIIHRLFQQTMAFPDQVAFFAKFRATALAAAGRLYLECRLDPSCRKYCAGLRSLRRDFQLFVRGLKELPTWQPDVPPLVILVAPRRRAGGSLA
jgi:hypothetical protein